MLELYTDKLLDLFAAKGAQDHVSATQVLTLFILYLPSVSTHILRILWIF